MAVAKAHHPEVQEAFSYTPVKILVLGDSVQRVPEPDPLPGISFDTRPDPIQF